MDEQFISKVYRSIILAWVIAITWALAFQKPWIALSITLGVLLGTAVLASNSWAAHRMFRRDVRKPSRHIAKIWLLKLPIMVALLYLLLTWKMINVLALCGGIVLVHLAIVLKTLGAMLVEHLNETESTATGTRNFMKRS